MNLAFFVARPLKTDGKRCRHSLEKRFDGKTLGHSRKTKTVLERGESHFAIVICFWDSIGMKISCNREKLFAAFQLASTVASARSPKEVLQYIKLTATEDMVTLMATDMDAGIRIDLEGVDVQTPGRALLSVQRIGSILRESTDEHLYFEVDGSKLLVRGLQSEFNLPSTNPDEFPTLASFEESSYHEIPARLFREMIRRTVFATDAESSRYALGGVLFEMTDEEVLAVATDGRRLARMLGSAKSVGGHKTTGPTTIIPSKTLTLMERSLSDKEEYVHVAARQNDVLVRTSRCMIFSRLVEGRYPNWRQVIPNRDNAIRISCNVGPFYAAIRQASVVADPESRGIDFQFGQGSLVVAARTADVGQSRIEIPIGYTGDVVKMTMDYRYVSDFLRVLESDSAFHLEISGGSDPALFSTDDGYAYVVMPMARDR
jgi:DNA polymerase III subunit beta